MMATAVRALVGVMLTLAMAVPTGAQTINSTALQEPIARPLIVYLSAGPTFYPEPDLNEPTDGVDRCSGQRLRVAFEVSEIYYDLILEEQFLSGVECSDRRTLQTRRVSGFDIAHHLGLTAGKVTHLELIDWTAWNRIRLRTGEVTFEVTLRDEGTIGLVSAQN